MHNFIEANQGVSGEFKALKAHLIAAGLQGYPQSQSESTKLFLEAANMENVTATTYANAGVMQKELGNASGAWQLFQKSARVATSGEIMSHFFMAEMLYVEEYQQANVTAFQYFQTVLRTFSLATTWQMALECFVANKLECATFFYHLASESGLSEASWDLACILRKNWNGATSLTDSGNAWIRSLYVSANRNYIRGADVNLAEILMNIARFSPDESEQAFKYYNLAAQRGSREAVYNLGYANHFGIGCPANRTRAKELYSTLITEENTLAENLVGYIMRALWWVI